MASFKAFGVTAFREAIDHGIMLAEQVEEFLRKEKGNYSAWLGKKAYQIHVFSLKT